MLYVSFVEILFKALGAFEEYYDEKNGVDLASVTVEEYESDPKAYVPTPTSWLIHLFTFDLPNVATVRHQALLLDVGPLF